MQGINKLPNISQPNLTKPPSGTKREQKTKQNNTKQNKKKQNKKKEKSISLYGSFKHGPPQTTKSKNFFKSVQKPSLAL